jgi:hypothetical protein
MERDRRRRLRPLRRPRGDVDLPLSAPWRRSLACGSELDRELDRRLLIRYPRMSYRISSESDADHGPRSRIVCVKQNCGNPLVHQLKRIPQPVPNHLSFLCHNHCWNTHFECICFHQSWGLAIPRSFVILWTTFPDSWQKISCGNPLVHRLNRIPQPVPNHLSFLGHNHGWNTNFECTSFHQSWALAIPRSFVIPLTTFPDRCHDNKLWQPPCTPVE